MDELFSSLAIQTVQLVGKAAFGAAGTIALKRVTEYVHRVPRTTEKQTEVERLRIQFEAKLRIVTPAIDLIEIISARGHSTMSSVLQLTYSLRSDIMAFSSKLERFDQLYDKLGDAKPQRSDRIVVDLKDLLDKIEAAVPLLNLALTTSGVHLGGMLPAGISPGRLMQASALLSRSSTWLSILSEQAAHEGGQPVPDVLVGDTFTLRLYSLFVGSVRPKSKFDFTWKEDFAKCQVGLWRVAGAAASPGPSRMDTEFRYELRIVEDLNDGRYHEEDEEAEESAAAANSAPAWMQNARSRSAGSSIKPGRVVRLQLDSIGSLHYTSAGSLLNIEDSNSPVLVVSFQPDQRLDGTAASNAASSSSERLPSISDFNRLDMNAPSQRTQWYALEVIDEDASDEETSDGEEDGAASDGELSDAHSATTSSVSLLEYMVRLAALETCEQLSHLEVPDEKLRLYLLDAPAAPAATDHFPGAQSLRSTPYRPAVAFGGGMDDAMTTPSRYALRSPLQQYSAASRRSASASALGSPIARASRTGGNSSSAVFETPRRTHSKG
ncbi:Ran-binding-domain-containing protein [Martensiomyces pterosporus]|nr:Ran-binding-domain-containing protein [Martensiomyces pterosporus]